MTPDGRPGRGEGAASDQVRYLALGVVAGIAVVLLVLAGTCVVLVSQLGRARVTWAPARGAGSGAGNLRETSGR